MAQTETKAPGINQITDYVIAFDLLVDARAAVSSCVTGLMSAVSPEVRQILKKQLEQTVAFQEALSDYIIDRGWTKSGDLKEQLKADVQKVQETLDQLKSK